MIEPPPWTPFFKRLEALATSAFLSIPYAGPPIAEYFNGVIIPRCTPGRDRALAVLARGLRSTERSLASALFRMLPNPGRRTLDRSSDHR